MDDKYYYVYIMTNYNKTTLYTGFTGNICKRVYEHKSAFVKSFTKKYAVKYLVYCECHGDVYEAMLREKQIKRWRRQWKIALIEKDNPSWKDLYGLYCRGYV